MNSLHRSGVERGNATGRKISSITVYNGDKDGRGIFTTNLQNNVDF